MQRTNAAAEHGSTAAEGMLLRREKELVAHLHELLFPSSPAPAPAPSGGCASSSSSGLNVAERLCNECSPVSCGGSGRRRRRGSKRVRKDEQHDEQYGGATDEKSGCSYKTRRKKKQGTTSTLVTTVPDFDGYQWRKYGQKQIEAARYPRSYYRCTNSMDQGCPAKRTVQRNDDENNGGGPPKYTVVYISDHTCEEIETVAPVILETTVRTKTPAARVIPAAAPDVAVVPGESKTMGESATRTDSPATSDITWSGGDTDPSEHGDYSRVFPADDWDLMAPAAAASLLQEMDFAGPIRSPMHIVADGWIDDLLVNEPNVLSSFRLFNF